MKIENINTLGELKASGYESISIKDELRNNLDRIKSGKPAFLRGVHGFENTVIPNGTSHFSRHNINLLGFIGENEIGAQNGRVIR
jgi:magnesium chelatase subunit I